jgi:hypothetical protein
MPTVDDILGPPPKPTVDAILGAPDKGKEDAPSIGERVGMGAMDPYYGMAQIGARMQEPSYFDPEPEKAGLAPRVDAAVKARERDYEARRLGAGQTGIDWARLGGNVISPFTAPLGALPGGAALRAAPLMSRLGYGGLWGALGGGVGGAVQPVPEGNYGRGVARNAAIGTVTGGALGAAGGAIAGSLARETAPEVSQFIQDTYRSAIRPSVAGKGTAPKIEQANERFEDAVFRIAQNKDRLVLETKKGKEVVGRAPRTLDEFSQAIAQTKDAVHAVYDGMARQAETAGAQINTAPIVAELRKFAASDALSGLGPATRSVVKYAEDFAADLERLGAISPTSAQAKIKTLNQGLTNFYRAASPKTVGEAGVDDLVANGLRGQLDATLERFGVPGYQAAKNEYGALKAIEGEVAHRAIVYGRRDPGGGLFGRLGTLASGEELIRFATSFDPSALASSLAIRGGRSIIERLNSPDRAVRRMFDKIEKLGGTRTVPPTPPPAPITGGMQPPRPSGKGQAVYGGSATPEAALQVRGGGTGSNPYTNVPNLQGHRPINPDDPLLRALDY